MDCPCPATYLNQMQMNEWTNFEPDDMDKPKILSIDIDSTLRATSNSLYVNLHYLLLLVN